MNAPLRYLTIRPVKITLTAQDHAAAHRACGYEHSIDTAIDDWIACALTWRAGEGYLLHGQPCPYSDEILRRYGTDDELHKLAERRVE